jgi:hypothetical protein
VCTIKLRGAGPLMLWLDGMLLKHHHASPMNP